MAIEGWITIGGIVVVYFLYLLTYEDASKMKGEGKGDK